MSAPLFDFTPLPRDENYTPLQNTYRNIGSGHGTVTTSGTPVQLTATPTQAKIIDVLNPSSNGGEIIIGSSSVLYSTKNGIIIEPGFTYRLNVTDLSNVWVDAQNNSTTFSYNYFW